jgi:hypothetical protein
VVYLEEKRTRKYDNWCLLRLESGSLSVGLILFFGNSHLNVLFNQTKQRNLRINKLRVLF